MSVVSDDVDPLKCPNRGNLNALEKLLSSEFNLYSTYTLSIHVCL